MSETIVLDPSAVATGRTEFDITGLIQVAGVDWGDAEISAYMAEASRGQVPVDFRIPNRTITIPLVIKAIAGLTYDQARQKMQAKVGLIHREGGWLKRVVSGTPLYADVVNATLKLGGSGLQSLRSVDIDATLTLECLPEFYGDEITLDDMTETTATELVKVLKLSTVNAVIRGDYPARVRIVIDEDQAQAQRGLIWGVRSRYYDSAAGAALFYEAEALTTAANVTTTALTGASGGTVATTSQLGTTWTPVLSTIRSAALATPEGGYLTHVGSYRVWARVRSTSATPPRMRFVWDVGDLTNATENDPVTIPMPNQLYLRNFGEVRIDRMPSGVHRWLGMFQAKGTVGGENVQIDKVWLQPLDEFAGRLAAPATAPQGLADYQARDEFNQTAGALTTKTMPAGGPWVATGNVTGFSVDATNHIATRATTSDTGTAWVTAPSMMVANPSTLTNVAVQVDLKISARPTTTLTSRHGVVARFVDQSNYVAADLNVSSDSVSGIDSIEVSMTNSSANTTLGLFALPARIAIDTWYTIRFAADTNGRWYVWFGPKGSTFSTPLGTGTEGFLALGGLLDDGRTGMTDWWPQANASTRSYDNFSAWIPTFDAVLNSGRSAELRSDGVYRYDAGGVSVGPVSYVIGDLPRLPPSGIENRLVEIMLKESRGDIDNLPDDGIDDISARPFYRPCWLFVPGA